MRHPSRLALAALLLLILSLAFLGSGGCDKDPASPTCVLSCWQSSSGIEIDIGACASSSRTCVGGAHDQYYRPTTYTCTWSNGRSVSCTGITYNSIGQIIGGTCIGVGATCTLR